jgi:uncharacterized surface protein with fasciclin (FAS1) repeats
MKHTFLIYFATVVGVAAFMAGSCKKQDLKLTTTNDVNIVGYLEKYPDSFSLWKQILDRTEISNFLNAFGSYTAFVPTNTGVTAWLAANKATSVETADLSLLKEIVKFHLLNDTIASSSFKDGKLSSPTMHGQFLITGARNEGSVSSFLINRQALVTQSNIRVGNGYIHVIDHVLEPAKLTIGKQLEANADFSIFVAALKATGYFKLLDTVITDSSKRWKTVLAESNQALADSNITSLAKLREKYPIIDTVDHLKLYVAYHIVNGIQFLGDIINAPSHLTLQPQEVISTKLINNEVVINQDVFNGVVEKGVLLIRSKSDYAATNGVWHTANTHFAAKVRNPTAVYWDLCTFPEIMKQPAYYKKSWFQFDKLSQEDRPIQDIDWHYMWADHWIKYEYSTTGSLSNYACNNDILTVPMGAPSNNNRAQWFVFTTPPIIKGRYKVWICYRNRSGSGTISGINVLVDGELMERPVNLTQGYPGGTDEELESLGWKKYTLGGSFAGRCVGTVDIKTTERHKLRLECTSGSGAAAHLDMVHFIPIDQKQWLPRFAPDGTEVW